LHSVSAFSSHQILSHLRINQSVTNKRNKQLVTSFDSRRMMLCKSRDDISSSSEVIVLRDRQTDTQTDITENNTTLAARGW